MAGSNERRAVIDAYMFEAINKHGYTSIQSIEYGLEQGRNGLKKAKFWIKAGIIVCAISVIGTLFVPFLIVLCFPIWSIFKKFEKADKYVTDAIQNEPELIESYFKK